MNFFKNVLCHFKTNTTGDIHASSTSVYETQNDLDETDLLASATQSSDELGDILDSNTSDETIENDMESKQKDFIDLTLDEIEFSTVRNITDESQPIGASPHIGPENGAESPYPVIDIDKFFDLMNDLDGKEDQLEISSVSSKKVSHETINVDINDSETCGYDSDRSSVTENYITSKETITNSDIEDISCSQILFYGFDTDFEEQIKQFTISVNKEDTGKGPDRQLPSSIKEVKKNIIIIENNIITGNKVQEFKRKVQESPVNEVEVKIDLNQNIFKKEDLNNNNSLNCAMRVIPIDDCKLISKGNLVTQDSVPKACHNSNDKSYSDYCSGYHSSDFEFISESEAEADGLYIMSSRRYKNKKKTSKVNKPATLCSNDSKPTTSNNALPSTANHKLPNQRDYRSMRRQFLTQESERHRVNHVIPEGQNFFDLFHGPNAPIPNDLYILENKSVRAQSCMSIQYEGIGFDMRLMKREEHVSEEDKRDAEQCAKKIVDMYPVLNRKRRRQGFVLQ